jgi:cysteinyl-tRNA synthetase
MADHSDNEEEVVLKKVADDDDEEDRRRGRRSRSRSRESGKACDEVQSLRPRSLTSLKLFSAFSDKKEADGENDAPAEKMESGGDDESQMEGKLTEKEVHVLLIDREKARIARDFGEADRIRAELSDNGVTVDDRRRVITPAHFPCVL